MAKPSKITTKGFTPKTIASELVAVQPMSGPSGGMQYTEFIYETEELKKAKDQKTTKEELIALCKEKNNNVHEAIIKHQNADSEVLHILSTHTTSPEIRELILKSGKLTQYHKDLIDLNLA